MRKGPCTDRWGEHKGKSPDGQGGVRESVGLEAKQNRAHRKERRFEEVRGWMSQPI